MILLIDNYDSFAHNLARYIRQLGQQVMIVRNDQIEISDIARMAPQAIIMSPGPCTPNEAGVCLATVKEFADSIPMLGVCLGHQAICQSFGGIINRVAPHHGRASQVYHFGDPLFSGIETPFVAGRYHSLMVEPETVPHDLVAIAKSVDGVVMAVAHRDRPVIGVQFHPESILTSCGYRLLANFLRIAKIEVDDNLIVRLDAHLKDELKNKKQENQVGKTQPANL